MDKEQVKKALEELKKQPQRKFSQSYDLIINLKNIVTKQTPVDIFVTMHYPKGRKVKVAAFVKHQFVEEAKKHFDLVLEEVDFAKYKDKKEAKKLAEGYDYFVSEASLMPKVAAAFGRVFGPKGKMPNPKLGCVVPPNANFEPLIKKLNNTIRMVARKATNLQCIVGKESQPEEEVVDNILTVYQMVKKNLPQEEQNIKGALLKLTMSKAVRI